MTSVAFVCVGNAGRSQMATAFAERERDRRGLDVEVVTGGTEPRDRVHDVVVEAMGEEGIEIGDRRPRQITPADVEGVDYVVTMGCAIEGFKPEGWAGEHRAWDVADPDGSGLDAVRGQRDDIERRVVDFFDELEADRRNADG